MVNGIKNKNIVCLGGGIGTSNLVGGLKKYDPHITVITSMADDGGSSGRLRKAYAIMPPGDIVSCIASLIPADQKEMAELLTYRFPGGKGDKSLDGHKLGNLIMLAEMQRTGDFYKALEKTKQLFGVTADILPATDERTHLSAITNDGRRVHSETTLDLALYSEPHGLSKVYITPKTPNVNAKVVDSLMNADCIISGPGDLYTNQLAVLVVPQIKEALLKSKAKKIFILNIANKPFETKGFTLKSFVDAITKHLGVFPFNEIVVNDNHTYKIPKKYHYTYINVDEELRHKNSSFTLLEADLVKADFPLYHDSEKLAEVVAKEI